MDKAYILPFIKSVQNVMKTMVQLEVTIGEPKIKEPGAYCSDVSAIIGISGGVEGNVVLSFNTNTAVAIVEKFTGAPLQPSDEDFADAVGELVNMISGGAKAQFPVKGVSISCPSVVIGGEHVVFGSKDMLVISIPCKAECGEFAVEVGIKNVTSAQDRAHPAAQREAQAAAPTPT